MDNVKRIMFDTNVLMIDDSAIDKYKSVFLPITVIEELDKLKKLDGERGYKARKAIRKIQESNNVDFIADFNFNLPDGWENIADNKIILSALGNDCKLISADLNVLIKAKSIGADCEKFEFEKVEDKHYKGYKELSGDTNFINNLFQNIKNYGFITNEYLILHNTDLNDTYEYRFDGEKLVDLKLPNSKHIKGMNSHQRLALDLLNNKNIPIKIILGKAGSGKTFLATKMGLYNVLEKGIYSKILVVREVSGDGKEIGFLPGDVDQKTSDFFKPIEHSLDGGEFQLQSLIQRGVLEKNIPYFLKGTTYNETYMLVDEAADLSFKQIKLVGTRLGQNSCITFVGDYKQSVYNTSLDNGLVQAIEKLKGDSLVGIVTLNEDIRSEGSKLFADMD